MPNKLRPEKTYTMGPSEVCAPAASARSRFRIYRLYPYASRGGSLRSLSSLTLSVPRPHSLAPDQQKQHQKCKKRTQAGKKILPSRLAPCLSPQRWAIRLPQEVPASRRIAGLFGCPKKSVLLLLWVSTQYAGKLIFFRVKPGVSPGLL